MPVPRRRNSTGLLSISQLSKKALLLLDINVVFQKTKTLLYWGFTPAVIMVGLMTEPKPSWIDMINIWE
jgi:ABC-type uncharacterized transport system permease subunit